MPRKFQFIKKIHIPLCAYIIRVTIVVRLGSIFF